MKKPKRSAAMQDVLDKLEELQEQQAMEQPSFSAAWLGRNLNPPVSRQTVHGWRNVPEHYVEQVAVLLDLKKDKLRPDLAAIFAVPKERSSRKRAA
jgi:hypothetical protein